jgi:hypothetical protein
MIEMLSLITTLRIRDINNKVLPPTPHLGSNSHGTKFRVRSKNPENFERRKKLFHITLAGNKGI